MRKTIESSQTSMIGILKTPILTISGFSRESICPGLQQKYFRGNFVKFSMNKHVRDNACVSLPAIYCRKWKNSSSPKAYLEPSQTSKMELFGQNISRL